MSEGTGEKWWKATPHSLQQVEIVKATDHSVIIAPYGRREAIDSSYHHWRRSKNEAIDAVVADQESEIKSAERSIAYRREQIAKLQANKE